jgi:UDP-N-acetylglucosamine--N-acetylmuramyl-(pentapeptide) pyrophosphoryl-undecaprenol N-acetylglucosamine transferase
MRILFTGGGSGGHIFPIIAVKQAFDNLIELPKDDEKIDFYYLGPDKFAKENLNKEKIETRFILSGKLRRYFSLKSPIDFIKLILGIIQSFFYLFIWIPDVIFSKGGYGSIPVVFVGWIYKIPIILHESDSAPGLANRFLAKFAKKIILSFPLSKKGFGKHQNKTILIGNPVRKELLEGNAEKGRQIFKTSSNKPVILILGGSQGAQKINEIVLNTLPKLLKIAEIIHISGEFDYDNVLKETKEAVKNPAYHLYKFLNAEELKHAYALTTLIINRAGAGSIFEIAALGKPSILIPLPSAAADHQRKNAYDFVNTNNQADEGRAIILDQENLTPNIFLEEISKLINNPEKLKTMSQKAKEFYVVDTAQKIRDEIIKTATRIDKKI